MNQNIEIKLKEFRFNNQEKIDLIIQVNSLQEKEDTLKKELLILDEELKYWEKEIQKLDKNLEMDEELLIWNKEIDDIRNTKKIKNNELEEINLELKFKIRSKDKLIEEFGILSDELKSLLFTKIKNINLKSFKNDSDELKYLIEILKEILKEDSQSELNLSSFLKILKENDININNDILNVSNKIFIEEKVTILPESISEFINENIKRLKPKKILNPWPTNGFMMGSLLKKLKIEATCLMNNKNEKEVFETFYDNLKINWKYNDDNSLNEFFFNIIVGFNPPNSDKISIKLNSDKGDIELFDEISYIEFLKAALKLDQHGTGFFILESNFLLSFDKNSVFSNLNNFNLFIDALIDLPNRYFSEGSDKILVIIKRKTKSNIFIGIFGKDKSSNDVLIENYNERKPGKIPQLGALTLLDSFFSFKNFIARYEIGEIGKSLGLEPIPICNIIKEINVPTKDHELIDKSNAIYLNISKTSDVLLSLEKIKKDEDDYVQIVFEAEKGFVEYIMHFLNTDIGIKIKESLNLDVYNYIIFKRILSETDIFIPNFDEQIEIVRIDSIINDISARAQSYKRDLWKKPNNAQEILEKVSSLDEESEYRFEKWVESLPFPIASILWESIIAPDYEHKVKYLLHFFEAFSEMNVTLMLSSLFSDENYFIREFSWCTQTSPKFRNWYLHPSFGNWNFFGRCLSKNIQKLLKNKYEKSKCLELFGNPENDFLDKITSEELYEIFDKISRYRNSWEGHGPIVTPREYENRYKILRTALSDVYQIISNIYENTILVLPIVNDYKDGIYYYTVDKFMGSRNSFKTLKFESVVPMDSDKIYLVTNNQRTPIEIINLLIFDSEACYYYNEFNRDKYKTQFVSYHYKDKPEIYCPSDKIDRFLSIF